MRPANRGGWRLGLALLMLVSFALQGYLTQTHIHVENSIVASSSRLSASLGMPSRSAAATDVRHGISGNKVPTNNDLSKCPICQAMGYAGQFIAPAAASLPPTYCLSFVPLALLTFMRLDAASHSWQGRAPPRI